MKTFLFTLILISFACKKEDPCVKRNCSDFSTQSEAQNSFNSNPDCYKNLDADNDGLPCESLPQ